MVYAGILSLTSPVLPGAGAEPIERLHSAGSRAVVCAGGCYDGAAGALHAAGCGWALWCEAGSLPKQDRAWGIASVIHNYREYPHLGGIVTSTGLLAGACTSTFGNLGPVQHP